MSGLTATRVALAEALAEGGMTSVHATTPQAINTDTAVVLAPADDYVTTTETFGRGVHVQLAAYLVVQLKNHPKDLARLDLLVEQFLDVLPDEWLVLGLTKPDVLSAYDWSLYGLAVTITAPINL